MNFYFLLWFTYVSSLNVIVQLEPSYRWLFNMSCYAIGDIYICNGNTDNIEAYQNKAGVIAVEEDVYAELHECQLNSPWHLQDISIKPFYSVLDGEYSPTIYIVDTFLDITHKEFERRASIGFQNAQGLHSHGTHVAGIAAGKTYGTCKVCKIVSVQVMDQNGRGSYSQIIQGLSWIAKQPVKGIVNFSIGGPKSDILNAALKELYKLGFVVVVSAGNSAVDSCTQSPGSAESAFTVAAHNPYHEFSQFSNFGKCVDIVAPGEYIKSALPFGGAGYMSGTSMAAPFVAGLAGVYLSQYKSFRHPSLALEWLNSSAFRKRINSIPFGTSDRSPKQTLFDKQCATKDIKALVVQK